MSDGDAWRVISKALGAGEIVVGALCASGALDFGIKSFR